MGQRAATLSELHERVEDGRDRSWSPGTWGAWLSTDSDWSAIVSDTSLQVNRETHPLHTVQAVRWSRGVIWASVFLVFENGASTALGGLTNRAALAFVNLLTAACVLGSLARLNSLLGDAEPQRDLWLQLTKQTQWLAQSEVKRFIQECPANRSGGDLSAFMARGFTRYAMNYMEPERVSLLAFLDGRDLLESASTRNEQFLRQELDRHKAFFDEVEEHPLTDEQRRAVITFDDNVMTVAAAGSGKTSVMIAKAGYAVTAGLFKPEEILLLAFNRSAEIGRAHV